MPDYHIHTPLCHHAVGTMESYIKEAINKGLEEICFSDHLTLQPYKRQLSMLLDEIPFYFQAVQMLSVQYRDRIKIKVGLEVDYHPDYIPIIEKLLKIYDFDMIGSSLHFIDGWNMVTQKAASEFESKGVDKIYEQYFKKLNEMIRCDYFDIICHIDMIKKFGFKPSRSFDSELESVLSKIKDKGLLVEINTSGFDHPVKESYPSYDIIRQCADKGIAITLGSDAHRPEQIGRYFDRIRSLLIKSGYKDITTLTSRKHKKVSIL